MHRLTKRIDQIENALTPVASGQRYIVRWQDGRCTEGGYPVASEGLDTPGVVVNRLKPRQWGRRCEVVSY